MLSLVHGLRVYDAAPGAEKKCPVYKTLLGFSAATAEEHHLYY